MDSRVLSAGGAGVMLTESALISPDYREQNRQMLEGSSGFGCGGHRHVRPSLAWAQMLRARSILDYGCGRGRLGTALRKSRWGGSIKQYDPCVPAYAALPPKCDLVLCVDVLEHIEPDKLETVLRHLRSCTRRGAYVVIATRPSNKTLPDGRNAHLIIESAAWWVRQFRSGWTVHRVQRHVCKAGRARGLTLWLLAK